MTRLRLPAPGAATTPSHRAFRTRMQRIQKHRLNARRFVSTISPEKRRAGILPGEIGEIHGTYESNQMVWTDAARLRDRDDDSDLGVGGRAVAVDVGRAGDSAARCVAAGR